MNEQVNAYISSYPREIIDLFDRLRQLVFDSAPREPEEKLWARMPSYSVGEQFVRLIPFKDHINIEAQAILSHREALSGYKITPKGMLQVFANQQIPGEVLLKVFKETFQSRSENPLDR